MQDSRFIISFFSPLILLAQYSTLHVNLSMHTTRHDNEHRNKSIVATTPSYLLCNCLDFDVQYLVQ
jgi:hypothetical protein